MLKLVFEVVLGSFSFLYLYRDLNAKFREAASRYHKANTTCAGTRYMCENHSITAIIILLIISLLNIFQNKAN